MPQTKMTLAMFLAQYKPFLELLLLTTSALIFDSPFNPLQLQPFFVDQCTTINPCKLILQFRFRSFVSVDSDACPCSWTWPHCCRNASGLNVTTSSCTHYITTTFRNHLPVSYASSLLSWSNNLRTLPKVKIKPWWPNLPSTAHIKNPIVQSCLLLLCPSML